MTVHPRTRCQRYGHERMSPQQRYKRLIKWLIVIKMGILMNQTGSRTSCICRPYLWRLLCFCPRSALPLGLIMEKRGGPYILLGPQRSRHRWTNHWLSSSSSYYVLANVFLFPGDLWSSPCEHTPGLKDVPCVTNVQEMHKLTWQGQQKSACKVHGALLQLWFCVLWGT